MIAARSTGESLRSRSHVMPAGESSSSSCFNGKKKRKKVEKDRINLLSRSTTERRNVLAEKQPARYQVIREGEKDVKRR